MKPFKFLFYCIIVLGLGYQFTSCSTKVEKKSPNLIYVFPDQFRKQALNFWDKEGFKGAIRTKADPVSTPNLDNFATKALVLTNAVSNCPLCSPHRGSLMTGLYPGSSGVPLNCNAMRPISSLRDDVICFSDVLKNEGYDMAYFGKWHLDFPTPNDPANPGHFVDPRDPAWDTYTPKEKRHGFELWYSYGTWDVHKEPHYYDTNGKRYEPKEWSPKHEADKVISYLKNEDKQRDENKPFAVFVSMNPPHSPYNSTDDCMEEDYKLYEDTPLNKLLHRDNANTDMPKAQSAPFYFANVTGVDREFGRIINYLKEIGEYDNTIIVFTSDHGETMCSQNTNDPKNSIYSEAFDVPFMIKWPEMGKARLDDLLMGSPDIMPTMLGLMGFGDKIPKNVQGNNYSDAFLNKNNAKRPEAALYIRNINGQTNADGLVKDYFPVARGIKTHEYTLELTINTDSTLNRTLFFNDNDDPYQLNNLPVNWDDPVIVNLLEAMVVELKRSNDPWYQKQILKGFINY